MAERKRHREQGIYRRLTVRMWGDAKVMALSRPPPCGQVLWVHLLVGEQTDIIPGLFKVGEAAFAEQLGWPLEGFREAFREVAALGMVEADWGARLVWVPKAIEHNAPASPNVVRSWADAWDRLPECPLKLEAWRSLRAFIEDMGEGFRRAFGEACPKPSPKTSRNQEQEQEQEQDVAAAARERAREAEPEAAPTETLPGTAEPGSDGGRAPPEVLDPGPPAPGHSAEAGTSSAEAADPPDAAPPPRRLVVVDEVELGPAGARVRAAVEQELGVALAVGGPEVHDRFEARIVALGGPEAVLSWMLPTLVERRRSGGPTPGSVAYLDTMLSDRPEPPPAMEPGPWELVVAYAREAFGSTSAQLVAALSRLTARFEGDDLVIAGPSAAMYGDRHGEDLARLVERALGRPVALRFEAPGLAAGGT